MPGGDRVLDYAEAPSGWDAHRIGLLVAGVGALCWFLLLLLMLAGALAMPHGVAVVDFAWRISRAVLIQRSLALAISGFLLGGRREPRDGVKAVWVLGAAGVALAGAEVVIAALWHAQAGPRAYVALLWLRESALTAWWICFWLVARRRLVESLGRLRARCVGAVVGAYALCRIEGLIVGAIGHLPPRWERLNAAVILAGVAMLGAISVVLIITATRADRPSLRPAGGVR